MVNFVDVPASSRVPFTFIEFDPSNANQGPTLQEYRQLLIGQKTDASTGDADVPKLVTSADAVAELYGFGSIIHLMAKAAFEANQVTETWVMALSDPAGATATHTLTLTGPSTAAGTIALYIGGKRFTVAVSSGLSANDTATAINTALQASPLYADLPVTSAVATNVVTLTFKHAGTMGNELDIRHSFNQGEELPAGIGLAVAAGTAGTLVPSVSAGITALADQQFHILSLGLNDTGASSTFELIDTELASRDSSSRQIEGHAFYASTDTVGNLTTLGSGLNSQYSTIVGMEAPLSSPWEIAAQVAAVAARFGQADPARPLQTLELPSIVGPALSARFTMSEREVLLGNGIATIVTDELGVTRIERLITTYQTNASGAPDPSFQDVNTRLTLSYLRFDFRTQFVTKFARFKLANDGTRFGAGQPVLTPSVARAFAVTVFRGWEDLGLVEGFDQFVTDLVVERNGVDPNRLDILLPPDLVNQLRTTGVSIKFLL